MVVRRLSLEVCGGVGQIFVQVVTKESPPVWFVRVAVRVVWLGRPAIFAAAYSNRISGINVRCSVRFSRMLITLYQSLAARTL
jgi:hypothetical protein